MSARSGSYEQAGEFVPAATGVSIGKRQLEQITVGGRRGRGAVLPGPVPGQAAVPGAGQEQEGTLPPLAISADGKGVAMRPEARRRTRQGPRPAGPDLRQAAGTGEKIGHKRMAETRCVFDVLAAGAAADPGAGHAPGSRPPPTRAAGGEPLVHLLHHRQPRRTIAPILDQAERRDPGHARTWIALVDGTSTRST